jgi:PAS domain S-box-containing protein
MSMHRSPWLNALNLAVLATVLLALVFQGLMLREGRRRALDLIATRAANRAQATGHQVEAIFATTDLMLQNVRDQVDGGDLAEGRIAGARLEAVDALIRRELGRLPQVRAIHVVDAQGRFLASTEPLHQPQPLRDRRYFQEQRQASQDRLVVSEPLQGRVSGVWGVMASRRFTDREGRFAGLVLANLDSRSLGTSLEAFDQARWVLALYDREQHLVARAPLEDQVIGARAADSRLAEGGPGIRSFTGPGLGEDLPYVWASRPLVGLPFFTVAGFSREAALATWRRDLLVNAAVYCALLLGALAITALQFRMAKSTRSILELNQRLSSSEDYFRALFEAVPDAVAVFSGENLVEANHRFRNLFQVPEGVRPSPWALMPHSQPDGAHSRDLIRRLAEAARDGTAQRRAWSAQRLDGTVFDSEITLRFCRYRDRDLYITIYRDLTEIRTVEEALHQARKLDALGQLAGGVAHDFNNMLSAILSGADVLLERVVDESQRKLAGTIKSAAEKAAQLTGQLLAFARKGKILSSPTDMHRTLREVVELLERTIDRRISVELRLEAPEATVLGDPSQLQNALLNLGVNARDAMPEGGRILFSTALETLEGEACRLGSFHVEPGPYLRIAVEDTGCGIPENHLDRIFDPFFTTKELHKGTGLGLSSIFGTMVSHRGAVTVESRVGAGSRFLLHLPLAVGAVAVGPEAGPVPKGTGTVLVIDDEDLVRTTTVLALESLGYEARGEGDVLEALAHFKDHHQEIDVVLVDLVMPRLSGRQTAEALWAIDPGAAIVLVSGFSRHGDVEALLARGARGFLQKPLARKELAELLARILAKE